MPKLGLLVLLVLALTGWTRTNGQRGAPGDTSLRPFLALWERAQSRFINGDPTSWKQNASQGDDATVLGAFGGYEKGWHEVGPRYDWASSQFKESGAKIKVEYLNTGVSGDLAFTVAIERQEDVRLGDQTGSASRSLRVTQVFRREGGAWKLLHRHADPLLEKRAPSAVPNK
jgi:ketosteroid isomerase-like protein